METAALLPQDCLRSRSLHKNHRPQMIYPSGSASGPKINRPAFSQSLEAGLLPLPGRTRSSLPVGVPTKEHVSKQTKVTKVSGSRNNASPSGISSDGYAPRILQRSKEGELASESLAQFVNFDKLGDSVPLVEVTDHLCGRDDLTTAQKVALGMDFSHISEQRAFQSIATAAESSDVGMLRADPSAVVTVAPDFSNGVARKPADLGPKILMMGLDSQGHDRLALSCLRRTGTDPSLTKHMVGQSIKKVHKPALRKHMVGQSTKKAVHISGVNPKPEVPATCHQLCEHSASFSCEERWAGPAYSSSPPPSSLPLPKLCLPQMKVGNVGIPPLIKQYSASVYRDFEVSAASSYVACVDAGGLDVAFATRSLRKLLNLDSC